MMYLHRAALCLLTEHHVRVHASELSGRQGFLQFAGATVECTKSIEHSHIMA